MAWTVGHEDIDFEGKNIEGQWEVDAGSENEAKNPDLIPYLLVGVAHIDAPYTDIGWYSASELRNMNSGIDAFTGDIDEMDMPVTLHLSTFDKVTELAHIMDRISEGVSLADFEVDTV